MKIFNSILALVASIVLFSISSFADEDPRTYMENLIFSNVSIGGNIEYDHYKHPQNPGIQIECTLDNLSIKQKGAETTIETIQPYGNKRCEFVINDALRRGKWFDFSFMFKVNDLRIPENNPAQWFAMMQFHNKPNTNESWRCPVLALESYNGSLRMFNRWDSNSVSTTINGTCANEGNSIQSRTVFKDISYQANTWYKFSISGKLSYSDNTDACLTVSLDDNIISEVCGPNTYNDYFQPYIKLGSYKPTTFFVDEEVRLEYKEITYYQY